MDPRPAHTDRFDDALATVQREFPHLRIEVEREHPQVEAAFEIPEQPRMMFPLAVTLQNLDELHMNAGSFWVAWFPCDDDEVFGAFIEALVGVLGGTHRIVEHCVGGGAVKAELQRPTAEGWQTVTGRSNLRAMWPWKLWPGTWTTSVLQNTGFDAATE